MLPGKKYTPEDFLRIGWRHKWIIAIPLVVVSIATVAVVQQLPNRYRSGTLILVVPQRVPESYVRSTVTTRIEDRLKSISQQILSRTRLERIIQDFNLYIEEKKKLTMEDIVEKMRGDIVVETVKGDAFTVSYTSSDARIAMKVTERLASMFIEENLRDREVLAEGTDQFIESQLEDARQRLVEDEKKLEGYRKRFGGELPSQMQSNLQVIQNTQTQLQSLVDSINRDHDQKLLLQRLVEDARALAWPPASGSAAGATEPGALIGGGTAADQLEVTRNALRAMELRLTPQHPDIVRMKRAIQELDKKAAAEALEPTPNAAPPVSPAEVARQNRAREMQFEIETFDRRIAEKEVDQKRLESVIAAYQRRVEAAPTRESELAEVTRDYETLQKTYEVLLAKKEDSKMAANLERRQIGEQFKILDPARMPEKPVSPNRPMIVTMGALAGLGIGIGFIALLEYLDTTIKTEEDVLQALRVQVLALIPLMRTAAERAKRKRRKLLVSCTTAIVVISVAAATAWKLDAMRWIR